MTEVNASSLPAVQIVRDPAKAAVFLQPARLRMLEHLAGEPNSGSGLARLLDLPRQQVNYHLRELEKEGFVEFVEERRRGNCMERIVRASAASYLVSPEALGRLGAAPEERRDRFSIAYLIGAAARAIRELASLAVQASAANKRLATLTLETEVRFRNAEDRSAFAEELTGAVARLASRYHDPHAHGGRTFRFLIAGYPAMTKDVPNDGQSAVIQ